MFQQKLTNQFHEMLHRNNNLFKKNARLNLSHTLKLPQVALTGQHLVVAVHVVHVILVDACPNATTCIGTVLQ